MSLQVGARGRAQCVVTEENTAAAAVSYTHLTLPTILRV